MPTIHMELKNKEILNGLNAMNASADTGKLGYAIARNKRKFEDAGKEYIDLFNDLVKENSAKYKKLVDGDLKFNTFLEKELGDLPEEKHEVEIYQIPHSLFVSGGLTAGQMASLWWLEDPDTVSSDETDPE